jgi:hypothetical protein
MNERMTEMANEVGRVMLENYDSQKYDPKFTLWGVSYFWKGNRLNGNPLGQNRSLVSMIFEEASRNDITISEPHYLIPKGRRKSREYLHYSMLCLGNRDLIESVYADAVDPAIREGALAIISDERLLTEAMVCFTKSKRFGELEEKVDFFDFLMRYDRETKRIEPNARKINGTYVPLAERLVFRYGEDDIDDVIFELVDDKIAEEAREMHERSSRTMLKGVSEGVQALYNEVCNYAKSRQKKKPKPKMVKGIKVNGKKKRVRVRRGCIALDAQDLLRKRKEKIVIADMIDKKKILTARTRNMFIAHYSKVYEEDPLRAYSELQAKISSAEDAEVRQIYEEVHEAFVDIGFFSTMDINHHMHIPKKRVETRNE